MPNIVVHYICGKLVANKLNITNKDYIKGNLYPDYVDIKKHYRIPGKKFEIPDIDKFIKEEKMSNKVFKLGFLTHLMLDKLYLDDFVINNIYSKTSKNVNIFESNEIYNDYTNISNRLLRHYNLSLEGIDDLMLSDLNNIDFKKYKNNTEVIRKCNSEYLKYLNVNSFIEFINNAVDKICNYIKINKYYN